MCNYIFLYTHKLHALIMYKFRAVISRLSIKFPVILIVRFFAKIQTIRNNIESSEGVSIDFFVVVVQKHGVKYLRI